MAERATEQPWERRKGETAKAHAAFLEYLEMGYGQRSIDKAWRAQRERSGKATSETARANGAWTKWSAAHEWVDRAAAYDAHMLEAKVAARKEQVQRALQRIYDKADDLVERHIEEGTDPVPKMVLGKPDVDAFAMKEQRQGREFLLGVLGISPKVTASIKAEQDGDTGKALSITVEF